MDYINSTSDLSFLVSKLITDLCEDEQFAVNSQEILSKLSEMSEMEQAQNEEIFSHCSMNSFELANQHRFDNTKLGSSEEKQEIVIEIPDDDEEPLEARARNIAPNLLFQNEERVTTAKGVAEEEEKVNEAEAKEQTSEETSTGCAKTKGRSTRDVDPINFLSLKRKDVIFKSIFRMMRRYYCKLLEDNTDYNRKEKCINIKHKQLVKCIGEGVQKLGFNDFGKNMSFYFAAFAYPSDMRKILEESKQQFRTQNEILSQATYIVELVDNWFNRFSKKILNDMLTIPQISFFIYYYLTNVDDLTKYPKSFKNCYDVLMKSKDYVERYFEGSNSRQSKSNAFILKDDFFLFTKSDS